MAISNSHQTRPTPARRSGRRLRNRLWRHHLPLALVSLLLIAMITQFWPSPDLKFRLSLATAYVGLGLLCLTLLLGPLNIIRSRPNPVSTDLRRDIGLWAAAIGVVHSVVGLTVHMAGRIWQYFVPGPGDRWLLPIPIRVDAFGLANYTGVVAGLLLIILALLSNDLALRRLGTRRWKNLQRLNYGVAGLILAHGLLYQVIERREVPMVGLFLMAIGLVGAAQVAGLVRRRRRSYPPLAGD